MTKRNFILLIIVVIIILFAVLGFFYFYQPSTPPPAGGGTNFFFDFNPFGGSKTKPAATPPTDVSGYVPPTQEQAPIVKLTKVSTMPIAGYSVFTKERFKALPVVVTSDTNSTTTDSTPTANPTPTTTQTKKTTTTAPLTEFIPALRYVARANGNIYQTFADKIEERKFSNTIIPKVYEALFGNKGESVIMRYLKSDDTTITTFIGSLPKEFLGSDTSGTNDIKGSFLPENITDVSISSNSLRLFYIQNTGDNVIGVTTDMVNAKRVQIFDSPFTEWLSLWPNSKLITLNTKPSGLFPGYVYGLNTDKKELTKIFGDVNGLTTLTSPNGKLMLYGDNNLSLNVYHIDTRTTTSVGVNTLPEKCIWGKVSDVIYCAVPKSINSALYPDAWYKGEISFSDEIWKIDLTTQNTTKLVDPVSVQGGEDIDGIKLGLDDGENYLFFVNKKDSYLWKLDLK